MELCILTTRTFSSTRWIFPSKTNRLEILNRVRFSWKLGLFGLSGNWGIRLLIFNGGIFIGRLVILVAAAVMGKFIGCLSCLQLIFVLWTHERKRTCWWFFLMFILMNVISVLYITNESSFRLQWMATWGFSSKNLLLL